MVPSHGPQPWFIADCNILKYSLLWQCVRSYVLCVQVATRLILLSQN